MAFNRSVTIRFIRWATPIKEDELEIRFFIELFRRVTNREVRLEHDSKRKVDIQIESVYGFTDVPNFTRRLLRFTQSNLPMGINFSNRNLSTNQQPRRGGRFNIFFTGENERPPQGMWDAYLSFDLHSYGDRNIYFPLWWVTSSDILIPTISPYLGKSLTIEEMSSKRVPNYDDRKKFCVAFIGKAWPLRMHALEALLKIGNVDVIGKIARNSQIDRSKSKFEIAQDYKFVFAFENDLFTGYVTEKAPEAWATGAVPLYWGSDPEGYLNPKALINLENFRNLEQFVDHVKQVNSSKNLWDSYANQPLLLRKPSVDDAIEKLKRILQPLVSEI